MSKSSKKVDKALDEKVQQFCGITGASTKEAKRFLTEYKRVDIAVDAFYNEPVQARQANLPQPSTSKLNALFDKYKDSDGDDITVDGTIRLCADLNVDPENVVLLAVAYELKSPRMGEWTRTGWVAGWKNLSCDAIPAMGSALVRLRDKLGSDSEYFQQVYNYTFEFSRPPGQRSLALDMAQGFWALLIPHGLEGGALSHLTRVPTEDDDDDDDDEEEEEEEMMGVDEEGWRGEFTDWWFEFLTEKGGKGVSKDTWQMFLEFVRTIDAKFEKYDMEAAWPSTIDDFVEYAKQRITSAAP